MKLIAKCAKRTYVRKIYQFWKSLALKQIGLLKHLVPNRVGESVTTVAESFWNKHWVILVNMVISVILGHEKTKIQNIIDLGKIDVFSVKTIIHNNNKKMGHLIWPLGV